MAAGAHLARASLTQRIGGADVEKPRVTLVPREKLTHLARETGRETVKIKDNDNQVHISVAGAKCCLHKPSVELPELKANHRITL